MIITSLSDRVGRRALMLCAGLVPLWALAGGDLVAGMPSAVGATAHQTDAPKAVIELFTSQGCANCPPADALLDKLADEPGIIALSLPIDYWNYLGWPDTRATPQNSARQMAYAAVRGDRDVFTPQVVVNGRVGLLGTDENEIRRQALAQVEAGNALDVPVTMRRENEVLEVKVGGQPAGAALEKATVWVAVVEPEVAVQIERGENAGREIVYRNVVREMQAIGVWRGQPLSLELPLSALEEGGRHCLVVLLQASRDDRPGPIYGAAFLH